MSDNFKYNLRGVSASKEDVHSAIKKIDKGLFHKAFCKIIPDIMGNDPEFCNIMHADGAGTKSSLAYIYWRETGDLSVWKGIAQDAIVMNTDDLLCVGATDNILLIVRSGEHLMGDMFESSDRPTLDIYAYGTANIAQVHIIRDNRYVYSAKPNQREIRLQYTDMQPEAGKTHYYYVRIEQSDGNLGWASPIWITYRPK
mgnify:CR=1 FL=1